MKKITGILAVMALVVVLSSCGRKTKPFDYGSFDGTTYTNTFFNFSLDVPEGWYVLDRAEIQALQSAGAQAIPNEGLRKEVSAADVQDAALLVAYSNAPGVEEGFSASIQAIAENVSKAPEVRSGGQFLATLTERLKTSGMNYAGLDNPVKSVEIGGVRFDFVEVKSDYKGYNISQGYYATLRDGFVLCFVATSGSGEQQRQIQEALQSIVFK